MKHHRLMVSLVPFIAWLGPALATSCSPADVVPKSSAPINRCPAIACSSYQPYAPDDPPPQCNAGRCVVAQDLDYVLVVSVPLTSLSLSGQSVIIPSNSLFANADAQCLAGRCVKLLGRQILNTGYTAPPSLQREVGLDFGVQKNLPIRVTYWPSWKDDQGVLHDAAQLGWGIVPFSTVIDPQTQNVTLDLPNGNYERSLAPVAPFDAAFPPDVANVEVKADDPGGLVVVAGIDRTATVQGRIDKPTFDILRQNGSLVGWSVFLRDIQTGRTLSAVHTMRAASETVQMNASHHPEDGDAMTNAEIVVRPPLVRLGEPELVVARLANQPFSQVTYPSIFRPVTVEGVVTGKVSERDTPMPAALLFSSSRIYVTDPTSKFTTNLHYQAAVQADAQGAYGVILPPGEYTVTVTPQSPAFARSTVEGFVVASDSAVQAGKKISLHDLVEVRGTCVLGSRALSDADVDFLPASALRLSDQPEPQWPRAFTVKTDSAGRFTVAVDEGLYDVRVRPFEGSRLPWFVISSRPVESRGANLGVLSMPAPIDASFQLVDFNGNPLANALVRAFATSAASNVPLEIGRALTDVNGFYTLELAGRPKAF